MVDDAAGGVGEVHDAAHAREFGAVAAEQRCAGAAQDVGCGGDGLLEARRLTLDERCGAGLQRAVGGVEAGGGARAGAGVDADAAVVGGDAQIVTQ